MYNDEAPYTMIAHLSNGSSKSLLANNLGDAKIQVLAQAVDYVSMRFNDGGLYTHPTDNGACRDWCRLVTGHSNGFFGVWFDPTRLYLAQYNKGDGYIAGYLNRDAFIQEIRRIIYWYENKTGVAYIDPQDIKPNILACIDLDLAAFFHASAQQQEQAHA